LDVTKAVVFLSRLERDNEIELLLECLQATRLTLPGIQLVIIGDGPDRPRVAELARRLELEANVTFTGAIYDEMELAPWMLSARMLCYPKNIGLSLLHAFGYGLPVITSDCRANHNPEIDALVDGENGLLYRDKDIEDMGRQWLRIFSDDVLWARLSANALRQVSDVFNMGSMIEGFREAIEYAARPRERR
jgi:glycosyltransferase involved in cell wall biosynthesis